MTGDEAQEVLGIITRIGPVVLSAAVEPRGEEGANLRRAVGLMVADTNMLDLSAFAYAFAVCLDLARFSKATLATMDRVRKAALDEAPVGLPAILTRDTIVRLTLACESRIVAQMTFRSRDEVDTVASSMNAAFNQASEVAADDLDAGNYTALVNLHGTVTAHLVERGRQLPRVIQYELQAVLPSLRMAQRAYADPTRHTELINENNVVHPAFMPLTGKMLAI